MLICFRYASEIDLNDNRSFTVYWQHQSFEMPRQLHAFRTCVVTKGLWLLGGFRRPRIAIDCRSCVTTGWQNIEFCRLSIAVDMVCCRIGEVNFATRLHDSFMKSTSKLRSETKSATRQRMTLSPKMKSSGMVA